jgi:hypothetical protein
MRVAVIILWLCILAYLTHQRVPAWHDNVALWTAALEVTPTKPRVLANLAMAYDAAHQPDHGFQYWARLALLVCDADHQVPQRPFASGPRPILHGGATPCPDSSPSSR